MTTKPHPMDPERLALARAMASYPDAPRGLVELLADRDYQAQQAEWRRADLARAAEDFAALEVQLAAARAEVSRLRARVRVEREDMARTEVP